MILSGRVPSEGCFVKIRHSIFVRIHGGGGGIEGAEACVADACKIALAGDMVACLRGEILYQSSIDFISIRSAVANVRSQCSAMRNDFFMS